LPFAVNETVPSEVHTIVKVIEVPAVAFGYGFPQVAVPDLETVCLPQLILSLKFAVTVTVRDLEGDEEVAHELTVGRDSSTLGEIALADPIVNVLIT
jgi:hypothetical protein